MADERRPDGAERLAMERDRRLRPERKRGDQRAAQCGDAPGQIVTGNINQWANPAAFTLPAPGTLGNLQRDFLAGPGVVDLDYAVNEGNADQGKRPSSVPRRVLNLLNHANFALPNASAFVQTANGGATPNPTFGKIRRPPLSVRFSSP